MVGMKGRIKCGLIKWKEAIRLKGILYQSVVRPTKGSIDWSVDNKM